MAVNSTLKYSALFASVSAIAVALGIYYYKMQRNGGHSVERRKATTVAGQGVNKKGSTTMDPSSSPPSQGSSNAFETILSHSEQEAVVKGKTFKSEGNKLYGKELFEQAAECYSKSLLSYPENHPDKALSYSNRAACYINLGKFDLVIEDCNAALALQPLFVKALDRRARAYEAKGQYQESLIDYTACCVIEQFTNESIMKKTERVLKALSEQRAGQDFANKKFELPSEYSMAEFFSGFTPPFDRPCVARAMEEEQAQAQMQSSESSFLAKHSPWTEIQLDENIQRQAHLAESYFWRAQLHLAHQRYLQAAEDIEKSIQAKPSSDLEAQAYHLYGTFLFLKGDTVQASQALHHAILVAPAPLVEAHIKLAFIHFEQGLTEEAMAGMAKAMEWAPQDPFVAYHRAELYALTGDFIRAIDAYDRCISLNPKFPTAYIHKARALISTDALESALFVMREAVSIFAENAEILTAYGETLVFQQKFHEANEYFDKALSLTPKSPNVLLNKAVLSLSVPTDPSQPGSRVEDRQKAIAYLKQAVAWDPRFDTAHLQLANLLLAEGAVQEAFYHYDEAIAHARTFNELVSVHSMRAASVSQLEVCARFPELAQKFK